MITKVCEKLCVYIWWSRCFRGLHRHTVEENKGLVGLKGDTDDEAMADFASDSRGPGASCLQLLLLVRNV